MSAYEKVQAARQKGRLTALSFVQNVFTDFLEMHGDRRFGDDGAVVAGIARLKGAPVTVIGLEKGRDTAEKVARNFGSANPEGYRKALRQMKLAEKFRRPVICFVDTAGAACGLGAEERGQGLAIAENLMEMAALQVPVISIVIGEGGSGGALALAVANQVWMLENAVYSVISPEGAASILWKDAKKTKDSSEALKLTAQDLHALGVIDRIIPEPQESQALYEDLREALASALDSYAALEGSAVAALRYDKFRSMGGQPL